MNNCCNCNIELSDDETIWAEGDLAFCKHCADELEECAYCEDMRYPENLVECDDKNSKWYGKRMCVGCLEAVEDG